MELTDIEQNSKGLDDLTLETQVCLLEFLKKFKDIEKGKCRGKGFANCFSFNHTRDPKIFTTLEKEFNELAKAHGLSLKHEVRIKVSDNLNKSHIFKLDFLESNSQIDVEISPNWHKNYELVRKRDELRKRLLNKVGIHVYVIPTHQIGRTCVINRRIANNVIRKLLSAKQSPNSLSFYFKGGE